MTFHDWINDIRWKYFTNEKAGLIFKELMKEFRIVYKMTENKRYYRDFEGENGTIIRDRITNEEVFEFGLSDSKDLCDLLNEQDNEIQSCKLAYNQLSSYVDANFDEYMTQKKLNEQIKQLEKENKELKTQLKPIQKICKKYKIPLEDLPEVLEEYITYDNEEYLEKLQNQ